MGSFNKINLRALFAADDLIAKDAEHFLWKLKQDKKRREIKQRRAPQKLVHKEIISHKKGLDFILSDSTPDRYDDIIMTSGWDLANFNRNPIALFQHQSSFPVGTWKDVRIEDNALRGELVLAEEGTSPRIDEIRKLVDADILRAVSVGFQPLEYEERKGDTYGLVYIKQELVECSLVSVPANPNALQVAKRLGVSPDVQEMIFGSKALNKYYTSKQVNELIEELLDSVDERMGKALADDREDVRQEIRRELRKEIAILKARGKS